MVMSSINRRAFLKTSGAVASGMLFLPACAPNIKEGSSYRFFTNNEGSCVIALCEQIIPGHKEFGGATEAGVIYYIDIQLAGTFKEHCSIYRESLGKLQEFCKSEFGKHFQDLSTLEQLKVMKKLEKNDLDKSIWEKPSDFFWLIHSHTMQGFYGSPIHGGNKDYMSFDMLRLDYPLNIGQNRYRKPLHQI